MKVKINNIEKELINGCTVAQVAESINLSAKGTAVAVNNKLVKKDSWANTVLNDGDTVVIISAAYGG